ncbi:helix-turn-helix domain-containing protein [Deinococcus sp. SM5_A1]|uniref:helix-turn-helix domain-containing protein n=1 Tax=Deinococcus sp. SM5_A1 TaxID=3379094 RepID=UPI00385B9E34
MTLPVPAFTLTTDELEAMIERAAGRAVAAVLAAQAPAAGGLNPANYYTVPEFAALLKVGTPAIYRDVKVGKIPFVRVGTSIRICETALDSYAQAVAQ